MPSAPPPTLPLPLPLGPQGAAIHFIRYIVDAEDAGSKATFNNRHETFTVIPTWSWVSVTSPISFSMSVATAANNGLTVPGLNIVAEFVDVQYTVSGLDSTNSVSDGVLTIRAPPIPAKLLSGRLTQVDFRQERYGNIQHLQTRENFNCNLDSASEIVSSTRI